MDYPASPAFSKEAGLDMGGASMTAARLLPMLVLAYLLGVYIIAGFVLADLEHVFPTPAGQRSRYIGFAVGWSAFPPCWLVAPFVTNFYEHGWMRPTLAPLSRKEKSQ